MKKHSYHHLHIWFRIVGLQAKRIQLIKENAPSARRLEIGKYFKDRTVSVVSFELKKGQKFDDLRAFLRTHRIPKSSYDIYISLVTSRDNDGVAVPDYVLELYRKIGGGLGFSFVCS